MTSLPKTIDPPDTLTVIIRDDGPLIWCEDSPKFRSVSIQLTEEQLNQLGLRFIGTSGDRIIYEEISRCFLQNAKN